MFERTVLRRLGMRFIAAAGAMLVATLVSLVAPQVAHAYEVRISITGGGQVTETTPANLVGANCTTSANNPTGNLGKVCFAGTTSGNYGHLWDVDYVATPKSGYRFVRWESDGTSRPGIICDRSSPAATTTTYTGATCKFRTPSDLQTLAVFVDDTAPQMNSLTGPNAPVNGAATFTFSAAADPTVTGFECRVAGVHDWTSCSSGRQENPTASGDYTFEVRAVDASGNRSGTSTWGWTVDKISPETSFVQAPSGTVASTSATFEFTSNEQGSFRCTLDAVLLPSCGSPKTLTALSQGTHVFGVAATDAAGNVDPTPVTRTWTVDTAAPEAEITGGPAEGSSTTETSVTFAFSSEATATFRCQLDDRPVETGCTSPETFSGLAPGAHTFRVWARDAVGNEDATPTTRTWTVLADTTSPVGTLNINGGAAKTTKLGVTLTLQATDDRGVSRMCVSNSATVCTNWEAYATSKAWKLSGKKAGTKRVYVTYEDAAGNRSVLIEDAIRYAPRR